MQLKDIKKVMRVTYNKWQLAGYTNEMSYLLKIKTDFNTAAWTTEQQNGKKVNVIIVGDKALEMSNEIGNKKRLLENLLFHEFGHSKFTTDKFELIDKELKRIYATFSLFNLFEDFRMEQKVRELTSHRFNWFNYTNLEFMGVGHSEPESLLLALKNAEHELSKDNVELVKDAYLKAYLQEKTDLELSESEIIEAEMKAEEIFDKVLNYFAPKILETQTSLSLMPVMKEWLDEFYDEDELKREQEQKERLQKLAEKIAEAMKEAGLEGSFVPGSGLEMPMPDGEDSDDETDQEGGDLQAAKKAEKDQKNGEDGNLEELNNNTQEVAGDAMKKEEKKEKEKQGELNRDIVTESRILDEFSDANILLSCKRYGSGKTDIKKARKLLPVFEKLLQNNAISQTVTRPSKRISTRNVILGRDKIYKRKVENSKNRKEISIVVDCSGSMGEVMPEMKIVIWIVSELARQSKVSGNIILSSAQGYQTIKMPLKNEDIDGISGYSCSEGLSHTFEATKSFLKKSDYVFCLTDGYIEDKAIDKKLLARQGVKPIGIYIGEEGVNLKEWFDRYVNRKDAKSTIDEIARKIK